MTEDARLLAVSVTTRDSEGGWKGVLSTSDGSIISDDTWKCSSAFSNDWYSHDFNDSSWSSALSSHRDHSDTKVRIAFFFHTEVTLTLRYVLHCHHSEVTLTLRCVSHILHTEVKVTLRCVWYCQHSEVTLALRCVSVVTVYILSEVIFCTTISNDYKSNSLYFKLVI